MFKLATARKSYREAGSLNDQINLFGFVDDHAFLTKTGDVGVVLGVKGVERRTARLVRVRFAASLRLLRLEIESRENRIRREHAPTIFGTPRSKPSRILGLSEQSRPKTWSSTATTATPAGRVAT
jgi:hypothetical protein